MAMEWTSFSSNIQRRLEVLSVVFYMLCGVFVGPFCTIIFVYLIFVGNIYWKIACISYCTFLWWDWNTGDRGGRGSGYAWYRNLIVWKYFMNFFPVDLVKTEDLLPDRHYLLCMFPHGLFCVGSASNLGTNHSKWSKLYPGLRPKLTTIWWNTILPISREAYMSSGASSASANALKALLNQPIVPADESDREGYSSNAVGLIVGGTWEAWLYAPNTYKCVIAKRRGFVRIALESGASLVPVISFGENDVYKAYNCKKWNPIVRNFIERFVNGNLQLFAMQYVRHPVTTVVGAPIHLKKTPNPSTDEIEEIHRIFCTKLIELFETHKSKYIENHENVHLEII